MVRGPMGTPGLRPAAFVLTLAGLAPLPAQDPAAIAEAAQRLLARPELQDARIGLVVADAGSGAVLHAHDAGKGFMTASNMKLVSGAVALLTLGADFTFATRLETAAPVVDGVLKGDLLLVGGGDPTLGGRQLEDPLAAFAPFVAALRALGVGKVEGRVVGVDDCQADEHLGMGWQWDYLWEDYAAACSGLNWAENVVGIEVSGATVGDRPVFRVLPHVGYVLVQSDLKCGPAGGATALTFQRAQGTSTVRVGGRIAAGAAPQLRKVAIENPTRYAAAGLKAALQRDGIQVTGPAVDRDDAGGAADGTSTLLHTVRSRPLGEILVPTLKDSVNLYAEQLHRVAAQSALGRSDGAAAAEHARAVLTGLGVDAAGMVVADGSGLSRRNLVRPAQLAALLTAMWARPEREVFLRALPVAGQDGTLRARFASGVARGRVHAKTGFIGGVVALSGYLPRPDADAPPLVFVTLVNNFTCGTDAAKAAVDAWVEDLARAAGWPAAR